ncbi:MAG TPA: formylglycine-generating enzyme family protein [Polyangiaceae bacterium]|jgi:formylglycine-generating enzyme required for sulfatase activity|nr:MAG: Serine/threonine-protein kinase pkn1 [Deltaproteobacteria bacterium ADurb.Bin207]HNS96462.1 formylglycine-generating enzyme family protein [Polyangiaceae bacterium]HNZ21413.1 formylglycine-generating enzyme family protein [Polyangiaceae bacterium]HOD23267.1 formylglycine-generating enzyme family protein [Polyangiaceae bacterium]HOE47411.1 formylglycine-generating enzyme family protein [Polyangiaceae bacterium]
MRWRIVGIALVLHLIGCEQEATSRPQWLVAVSTDAVVPLMGNRLLVELLNEQGQLACPSCRREAVVALPENWPATFGIAPPTGSQEVFVRVQFYRADRPSLSIESLGRLPPLHDGVNSVSMHLSARCLGKPVHDTQEGFETCSELDPSIMMPPPVLEPYRDRGPCGGVGTTDLVPSAEHRYCDPTWRTKETKGMVCVPGGMFFLGDELAPVPSKDVRAITYPERLVRIRSFFMDRREVTVREYREYLINTNQYQEQNCPEGLHCRDESEKKSSKAIHCTFPLDNASHYDGMPLNCVSWRQAYEYCRAQGKRLPTEAEWEYVASQGEQEKRYPFGDSLIGCDGVYVARGESSWRDDDSCLQGKEPGPAGDKFPHDRVVLPWTSWSGDSRCGGPIDYPDTVKLDDDDGNAIQALAGNVSEWTQDRFAPYEKMADDDLPCWSDLSDPWIDFTDPGTKACKVTDPDDSVDGVKNTTKMAVRGGSWRDPMEATWSATRNSAPARLTTPRPEIGFRCVLDPWEHEWE